MQFAQTFRTPAGNVGARSPFLASARGFGGFQASILVNEEHRKDGLFERLVAVDWPESRGYGHLVWQPEPEQANLQDGGPCEGALQSGHIRLCSSSFPEEVNSCRASTYDGYELSHRWFASAKELRVHRDRWGSKRVGDGSRGVEGRTDVGRGTATRPGSTGRRGRGVTRRAPTGRWGAGAMVMAGDFVWSVTASSMCI